MSRRTYAEAPDADDFASRAMVAVIAAGLRAQGVDLAAPAAGGARPPRPHKVALLHAAVGQAGPGVLLGVGAGLDVFTTSPVFAALLAGGRPWGVLERWGRLERYVHGRHRTRRTPQPARHGGTHACEVVHHARAGAPPSAVEGLAVLGVQAALLRRAGALDLAARCDGIDLLARPDPAVLDGLLARDTALAWVFEWREAGAMQPIAPIADDDPVWPPPVAALAALLRGDLLRRWRLEDVAAAMGCHPRALQRQLHAVGWSFARVLAATRQRQAAQLLASTTLPLAEIGYLCGHSDQAHFNRCFERAAGVSPGQYRRAFGADDAPSA